MTSQFFVSMLAIVWCSHVPASGQNLTNREIAELLEIEALQITYPGSEQSGSDKPAGWIISEGNACLVVQEGKANHAYIAQVGGAGNTAKVLQRGNGNRAGYVFEHRTQWGIWQSGSINYTEVKQFGNLNNGESFQYGNCNEINIAQHGGTGLLNDYGGYVNKTIITQTGDGNSAIVTQTFYP